MLEHLTSNIKIIEAAEYTDHSSEEKIDEDEEDDHAEMLLISSGNARCTAFDDPREGKPLDRPVNIPDTDEEKSKAVSEEKKKRQECAELKHAYDDPDNPCGNFHPRNSLDYCL